MQSEHYQALTEELQRNGLPFCIGEPLSRHTTFKIGGEAQLFCQPETLPQLIQTLALLRRAGVRWYLLGNGSNTLFCDAGFAGAVVSLCRLQTGESIITDENGAAEMCVSAGKPLTALCRLALQNGLTGLEFAYGIPGTVGGAVYMNAGAYGGEMRDVLSEVTFLDEELRLHTLPVQTLQLGYRTSVFEKEPWCIVEAKLHLQKGNPAEIQAKMDDLMQRRQEKQPLELPSAGSTFKRPQGAFAGKLIEDCGLRGFTVGGAQISEKHCGFVVNRGGATCADVLALTEEVRRIVQQKTGYVLEREIRIAE